MSAPAAGGAEQGASGSRRTWIGAGQQPHQMGHHQTDKPIMPATATATPTPAAVSKGSGAASEPAHLLPDDGLLHLPQQQGVEGIGIAHEEPQQGDQGRQRQPHVHSFAGGQGAHLPQARLRSIWIVRQVGESAWPITARTAP